MLRRRTPDSTSGKMGNSGLENENLHFLKEWYLRSPQIYILKLVNDLNLVNTETFLQFCILILIMTVLIKKLLNKHVVSIFRRYSDGNGEINLSAE